LRVKAVIAVLVLIQILFGINFTTSKIVVTEISPFFWSNIRFLFAGVILLFISLIMRRPHPKVTKEFLLPLIPLSLLGMSVGQSLFMLGLRQTSSINTAVITTTIPILTLAISIMRGKDSITMLKAIGVSLAFIGVLTIKGFENINFSVQTLKGDFMVLLASMCFALFLSFSGEYVKKYDNFWVTTWMFLISGVLMFIFNFSHWMNFSSINFTSELVYCAVYSIIGATIITYFLNNWALARAPSGNVALFIYLQPVVAAIIGFTFLGEQISFRLVFSTLCIFTGLLVTIYRPKKTA
jgi:drug/metabolite transporter (DMT)-like permease